MGFVNGIELRLPTGVLTGHHVLYMTLCASSSGVFHQSRDEIISNQQEGEHKQMSRELLILGRVKVSNVERGREMRRMPAC